MRIIIPAAGKGTRMQAITQGGAKEMVPLGSQPAIEAILTEARTVSDDIVVVSAERKTDLNHYLAARGVSIKFQADARGLADAILRVEFRPEVAVLLPDAWFPQESPLPRMANLVGMGIDAVLAVETVPDDQVSQYGIAEINDRGAITRLVEKPQPSETASRYAVAGRYAFGPAFLSFFGEYATERPDQPGEFGLTEVIQAAIEAGLDVKAVALQTDQPRIDIGDPAGYRAARQWLLNRDPLEDLR